MRVQNQAVVSFPTYAFTCNVHLHSVRPAPYVLAAFRKPSIILIKLSTNGGLLASL